MTTCASREPPRLPEADGLYDKCLLHDAAGIRALLQQLIDARCTLIATGEAGAVSMVTAPLSIEGATLWIDVPQDHAVLQRLLRCPKLAFEGVLDKVTLRFSSGPPALGSHGGRQALHLPVPERLLHMQRRELMRREPVTGPLHCLVYGRDPADPRAPTHATIRDIGGGGLALLTPDDDLPLAPGDLLPGCELELPGVDPVVVTLRVCHVRHITQRGREVRQAGCAFVDLPAAAQTRLFRYLMQLDREQLARRRELEPL
ncbi:flagellar brake protein [Lysobacter koreensis]|uniref:Flagellar brake protein n=1 Tax=Lysobacter koreensis TaxID=266122 RepID=A0ABW2YGX7_9GAMM